MSIVVGSPGFTYFGNAETSARCFLPSTPNSTSPMASVTLQIAKACGGKEMVTQRSPARLSIAVATFRPPPQAEVMASATSVVMAAAATVVVGMAEAVVGGVGVRLPAAGASLCPVRWP